MAEWRFARGWTDAELKWRLAEATRRRRSFDESEHETTPERGWNRVRSEAVIACEPPGPPLPDGAFERAWQLVDSYAFSDPQIISSHFDPGVPLLGRHILLEARVAGLRYLGPVVVAAVCSDVDEQRTVRGFRYDSLEGHFERGWEWFLLEKDHASGAITFHIRAAWQQGELPNVWSRLGFQLLVRRYQRAWHRLAQLRLRAMLDSDAPVPTVGSERLVHEGPDWPTAPARSLRARHRQPRFVSEREERRRLESTANALLPAAAIGAITGSRSLLGPALFATLLSRRSRLPHDGDRTTRALSSRRGKQLVWALSLTELIADKTPWIPDRTAPLSLLGRMAIGGWLGSTLAEPSQRATATAIGAATAAASAFALRHLRHYATTRLGLSNIAAGLCEDAIAITAGLLLVRGRS